MKFAMVTDYPGYRVSTCGVVQTCKKSRGEGYARVPTHYLSDTWRTLKVDLSSRGRPRVTLSKNSKVKKFFVSNLVLQEFVGPRPEGMEACHENGDYSDNRVNNLRWDTHFNNIQDKRRHGTNVLYASNVRQIRLIGYPAKQHADRYGVPETLIELILERKAWQHVR